MRLALPLAVLAALVVLVAALRSRRGVEVWHVAAGASAGGDDGP